MSNFNKKLANRIKESKSTSETKNIRQTRLESSSQTNRYFQHCQSDINNNFELNPENKPSNTVNSLKSAFSRSPAFSEKIVILKNSLSSSRDGTPTIIKLSKAGTHTPLLHRNKSYASNQILASQKRLRQDIFQLKTQRFVRFSRQINRK